jgi:hypothetical protein
MVFGRAIESYGDGTEQVKKAEASTVPKRIAEDKTRLHSKPLNERYFRLSIIIWFRAD